MTAAPTHVFDLPERLAHKADPELTATDELHFAALGSTLGTLTDALTDRLQVARAAPARGGTQALERDQEVHRLTAQLRLLQRYGLDLCLGRMTAADSTVTYVGRLGMRDRDGAVLLVDWRTPAAEPFFAATHADPMGLLSRRRYRWSGGRIADFWDEVFTAEGLRTDAALDDQSAFVASLSGPRSERMRDVLATIQSDQDAIIRASSRGALVVDGGPGTGKTVVALHRTAFLLYSDPRLGHRRGGVLFIGPSIPYLDYVSDVLPSLGEEGVLTCTLRELVPEGGAAVPEQDPEVARWKSEARMVDAVEPAVALYEEPPGEPIEVETPIGAVSISRRDWVDVFAAVEPGTPHNEARAQLWSALGELAADQLADELAEAEVDAARLPALLRADEELAEMVRTAWPLLEPTDLIADLWSVPAYLRRCAPWLSADQIAGLQRAEAYAWTDADLPLLDAARRRLGDPRAAARLRRREAAQAAARAEMDEVIQHLIASDPTEMQVMSMLRGQDLRGALDDDEVVAEDAPDRLAGPFAHVVVDEAQELTDAQWQLVLARCPSRSLTIVGDRAQARHGFSESWVERLTRIGLDQITVDSLTVNYRTPEAVMAEAEPVIRAAVPDANVPTSIRDNGLPVVHGAVADRDRILADWLAAHDDGIACVIGDPSHPGADRVRSLTPATAKGLEFDLVVLIRPGDFGDGAQGAVDRYVAMTRATGQLVILE
ncbi:RNA polymerase recycling motor ATPase HelR [Enemella evansiae]|uniref:AAA family ATPase n=1 Tax=Enemella evansiae TaxID=2016499 RepID=A0A255GIH7_9ACTN|nr:RNA polymerase recycling motor ATPase HelR [Enemella evansiae]OYO12784.1 AAA family ATPase [Enemella evansiae]OYO19154.1 AAA family ATPase [Enemella evansiae]TDO91719.1 DNA helicase IV [Enemella evansiae]